MAFTKINAAGIGTTETVTVDGLTVINNESIGGNLTVTGNATISGVLTYEDVTNVDSVGLITARNGIVVGSGITLSKDGDIFATGVTTSTTFVGALTGNVTGNATGLSGTPNISAGTIAGSTGTFTGDVDIADKIVHTGDTNTAIRFPAADTFTVETGGTERFRIDSSGRLQQGSDTSNLGSAKLNIVTGGEDGISLGKNQSATVSDGDVLGILAFQSAVGGQTTNSAEASIKGIAAENSSGSTAATDLAFFTKPSGTGPGSTPTERVRIDSSGRLLAGTATSKSAGSGQYAKLNIEGGTGTTENFVSFSRAEAASAMSANDEVANLTFNDSAGYEFARIQVLADAATGATDTPGRIVFKTTADGASSSTERLRIDSSGIVESNSSFSATYSSTGSITPHLRARNQNGTDNIYGGIQLRADRGTGAASIFNIACLNTSTNFESVLIFQSRNTDGNFTEKMRIAGSGDVLIGTDSYAYTKPLNVQGGSGAILSLANYDTTTYAQDTHTSIELRLNTGNTGNQNGSCEIRAFKENGTNGNSARGLNFWTAGNGGSPAERLRIDSDGNVTKPYTPFFSVYGTGSNQTYNDGDVIDFENATHNVGSHFKMTSGTGQYERFIAPVAGVYIFTFGFFPKQ